MTDLEGLRQKYAEERARRLRPDGIGQYVETEGVFAGFADDPWSDPGFERSPVIDDVDVALVGAGFGGLLTGAAVQVSGFKAGEVTGIELDGPRVRVTFSVDKDIRLGDRTEAAIKTRSILGAKILELTPRGDGRQSGPIPLERTTSPYQLPDALGDLTTTISGLDIDRLSDSWKVLADEFAGTPAVLEVALQGVARFSQTVDERDDQLRRLLTQ